MIILHCAFCDAHQAIYRTLNQTVATRLRIGVYVFDNDGCQYPDRTMCGEAIDTRLFANNARVNKSIMHPIFIDEKKDRARKESRNHLSKVQGGYPMARILGTTDIPRYRELQMQSTLSTFDEPPGLSLGEKSQIKPRQIHQTSTTSKPFKLSTRDNSPELSLGEKSRSKPLPVQRASTSSAKESSRPSTRDEPSGLSLGERSQFKPPRSQPISMSSDSNSTRVVSPSTSVNACDSTTFSNEQSKTYRSVLIASPPSFSVPDKRLVIDDKFYQPKPSVFERLGPSTTNNQVQSSKSHKRSNVEPIKPAKRLSVDTSDGLYLDPRSRKSSSIRITH